MDQQISLPVELVRLCDLNKLRCRQSIKDYSHYHVMVTKSIHVYGTKSFNYTAHLYSHDIYGRRYMAKTYRGTQWTSFEK